MQHVKSISSKLADYSTDATHAIAVFCWSRTEEGTPQWAQAERVGELAATHHFSVVTGGYCGSMEAVSKGAKGVLDARQNENKKTKTEGEGEAANACEVIGVVVSEIFPDRRLTGNAYLTRTIDSNSMLHRIDQMTRLARYFVILPGTMGTLQEMTCVWMSAVLHPKACAQPVLIAFREPWERCCREIATTLHFPEEQIQLIHFVDTPEEMMEVVLAEEAKERAREKAAAAAAAAAAV